MNKFVLLSSLAAFSIVSGVAGAVTLKNDEKTAQSVTVDMGGKKETVSVKAGASYDTQGKDASFTLGKNEVVVGKGGDKLMISGGKIIPETSKPVEKTVKTETTKPAESPVAK